MGYSAAELTAMQERGSAWIMRRAIKDNKRYTKVDIEFYDYDFRKQNKTYEWPEAVIIQHEVDHLNGYLISMKGTEYTE